MVLGEPDSNTQKNETRALSYTILKINSKWMKELTVRQETVKTLEEKVGNKLFDLSHSNFLLNLSLKARELKAKMNYWDLIKIKSSALQRKQSTQLQDKQRNGRRCLQMTYRING